MSVQGYILRIHVWIFNVNIYNFILYICAYFIKQNYNSYPLLGFHMEINLNNLNKFILWTLEFLFNPIISRK